jgi:DNA-binding transcriptional MerR regulator
MFAIGTFSQFSAVSIRTLRHYDDIGLFRPVHVDPATGYRFYAAAQLAELNRIVILKELGFTLAEITRMTESEISGEQMLGMLRLRQSQAEQRHGEESRRLAMVAVRISLLERTTDMPDIHSNPVVVKPLPAMRLAVTSEGVDGFDVDFSPVFQRLFPRLFGELGRLGINPTGPTVALYDERPDGRVDVLAAVPVPEDAELDSGDVSIRVLAPAPRAATIIHHGPMTTLKESYGQLMTWMQAAELSPTSYSREIYLDMNGDPSTWVTELQFVLA